MRLKYCAALKKMGALGLLLTAAISGGELRASTGLGLGVRVHQEFYTPLIPVTRNFRPCFKTNANGNSVMELCSDQDAQQAQQPERGLASQPGSGPQPSPVPQLSPASAQGAQPAPASNSIPAPKPSSSPIR